MERERAIIFGTWDLLHVGHIRAIQRARNLAQEVIVGVEADALVLSSKNILPSIPEEQRLETIEAIKGVSEAFIYRTHQYLEHVIKKRATCVIWNRQNVEDRHVEFLYQLQERNIKVVLIHRTEGVSATDIKRRILLESAANG